MCRRCKVQVERMGVADKDLPLLPFREMHQRCVIDGCSNKVKVRDYGIFPFVYWPVKVKQTKIGWRGGWYDVACHWYVCSKHYKAVKERKLPIPQHSEEYVLSLVSFN